MCAIILTTAISAFFAAITTLIISLLIERKKKPDLFFEIEDPPCENTLIKTSIKNERFLRVNLCNRPMHKCWRWFLDRNAAMHCSGSIQFYSIEDNGKPFFTRPMPIRWAGSDQPVSLLPISDGQPQIIFDFLKYNAIVNAGRNCFPDIKETIDVAARFDDDEECYGWCTENYIPGKGLRNSDWKLPKGKYFVEVTIFSAGEKIIGFFLLDNTGDRQHFRLFTACEEDILNLTSARG